MADPVVEEKVELPSNSITAPTTNELPSSSNTAPMGKKSASFWLSFLALCFMVFIVSIDSTGLAVALPVIARQLSSTTLESFWANIAFTLAVVVVQPVYTSTSDVLGRKIPLYTAFVLFSVGSLVFALAPTMPIVILGRTIQGFGGSGLDVLNEIIVADITTMKERPFYLGLTGIPLAAGMLLGPILGALLAQYVSWRWIGYINLPLTFTGFLLVFFFLHLRPLEGTFLSKIQRLDLTGMGLFTIGCTTFVLPLSWAGSMYAWNSWRTLLPLILGILVLIVFVLYERKPENPVLPHRLFRSVTAVTTLFGAFIHGVVVYNLNTYLALSYQAILLQTPIKPAVTLLPMNVVSLVSIFLYPGAVQHFRKYLPSMWMAWVSLAVGTGLLYLIGPNSSAAVYTGLTTVLALGYGGLFTVISIPMQASVPNVDDTGLAVGLLVFVRLSGGLIGLALGSTIFSTVFGNSIASFGPLPSSLAVLKDSSEAVSFIPKIRELKSSLSPGDLSKILSIYSKSLHTI
ncbi:hypothetical protein G7Y89_g4100 [Cudoniella acicularis]|uniref:Major facilitator superfamily (MFS) profile domain-containing protein n=1 Tax=Cudoniella acicularis TaxID=354080 RepID=A0A8H4RRH7_9HELO|nr:hypothetical protein G7Y89_g4100 [Cudoniella acicularis]